MFWTRNTASRQLDSRRDSRSLRRGYRFNLDALEDRRLMASSLVASSFLIAPGAVEGKAFKAVVATFTDSDGNTDPAQYAATINWGDGQTSRGIVVGGSTGFEVVGTHIYVRSGAFRATVQIGDADNDSASVSTTNVVAEAPIAAAGIAVHARRAVHLSNVPVAMFSDPDSSLRAKDFSAKINWGDGQTSTGKIVVDKAIHGFEVLGSHIFKATGAFAVKTTILQGKRGVTSFFTPSSIISDGAVAADHIDPNFVNPWGLAAPKLTDFWDSNNGTGTSTVFDNTGNISAALFAVSVPPPNGASGPSAPSGIVSNSTSSFVVSQGSASGPAAFIFATEDGTISGWNPKVGGTGPGPSTHAVLAVDNSASGAVYKGLAILTVPAGTGLAAGPNLFVTNFHAGTIEAYTSSFAPETLPAGAFQDPAIPTGFAPFGIQTMNGNLYVTYAKQDGEKHDDVAGAGNGYVDVYSPAGVLLQRLGGGGIQPELNSPWGLVQAPASFGPFSNAILVGNFGDSHINAFDPNTGAFLGQLNDANGQPLVLNGGFAGSDTKGLWALFDFPTSSGPAGTLYFSAGVNDESDGLFGSLTFTQVAAATATSTASVVKFG